MKKTVIGILAHVDAGKTTLSEAMLYFSGMLRKPGRVDHGNAFLDNDIQERERGITIFSKQAVLQLPSREVTLLDTPGHVDFSAEMERALQVIDCAILVISGTDGVQGHTRTLWQLLSRYNVPTFLFVNKMDLAGAERQRILSALQQQLSGAVVDFTAPRSLRDEALATADEAAFEEYLDTDTVSDKKAAALIAQRKIFPCYFGAALKFEGIEPFLQGLDVFAPSPQYNEAFGAKVFKISRDSKNTRLTWMKITGGTLRPKTVLSLKKGGNRFEEKADQLRLYSGAKFETPDTAAAGSIVAVTGLSSTYAGQGLGFERDAAGAFLEPVLNYKLILPEGTEPHTVLPKLKQLEEEDPLLRILWNEQWKEIHVRLMGQVQLEVLKRLILDRFGLDVRFDTGKVVYKETISDTVEGVGHFEPLRHYAEVHLILSPGERGSGIQISSCVSADILDLNWQRLILTHLEEREHPGVLTGSPLTDVRITLAAGRAHLKHTEGGDFRQATYRAVRQGLMQADSLLLEPFYDFRLELPHANAGRALNDLQNMGAVVDPPEMQNDITLLTGYAPVAGLQDYWREVTAYTRGLGQLSCSLRGYEPCRNTAGVIAAIGYDPERDTENPADSVFCSHGAGTLVKWNEVPSRMHLESCLRPEKAAAPQEQGAPARRSYGAALDKELTAIFERTYGKTDAHAFRPQQKSASRPSLKDSYSIASQEEKPEYLLVDGYNIIFSWDELKDLAKEDMAAARGLLEDILANYRAFRDCTVILVFDAYKVKGNPGSVEQRNGIYIVYTKEAETADVYIERTTYALGKHCKVRVATSDALEQMIILGHGALRISANAFRLEMEDVEGKIAEMVRAYNMQNAEKHRIRDAARISPAKDTGERK
ncbi:MAG: GTP-binding protein [Clostridiales bacterium]|nr:GTP-binding protein [Clostridiales bacterium]